MNEQWKKREMDKLRGGKGQAKKRLDEDEEGWKIRERKGKRKRRLEKERMLEEGCFREGNEWERRGKGKI